MEENGFFTMEAHAAGSLDKGYLRPMLPGYSPGIINRY